MQTIREFTRKTKRGNILKIVREHYLRDDLGCGLELCENCVQDENTTTLSADHNINSNLFSFPHYVVLDTNVVLNQIDVLEEDVLCNVIVLSTVLNELKHNSSVVYKRFYEIIKQKNRRFFVFVNEHHKDTYVEREPGESSNDRNDRAIRLTTKWYGQHLLQMQHHKPGSKRGQQKAEVVLLTDDEDNYRRAELDGILVARAEQYIKSLVDFPLLFDKYAIKSFESRKNAVPLYDPHFSTEEIIAGIKSTRLLQGTYHASRENYLEGAVTVDGYESAILLQGRTAINRAVDGDIVVIELLPESEWSAPSEVVLEDTNTQADEDLNRSVEELELLKAKANAEKRPTGKVVGIVRRKWRQYCGILQPNQLLKSSTYHIFVPTDRKIPRVRVETRQAENLQNQRIVVAIDSWPRTSHYPHGHFVRCLGPLGDMNTENEVILLEHDVPHSKFSEEVLNLLPKLPWCIKKEDYEVRLDLRDYNICSVDPPGCTDIDDALHCRILPNGNFEVGVHIADVSHFIRPGNALDKEAAARGTTVYLVGKRIDMVPELLSSNLCSLVGDQERFAFSCIWELDDEARIVHKKFHKSVIKSKRAMTYEEAQLIIDDKNQRNELAQSLRNLNSLAKKLKKKRMENGCTGKWLRIYEAVTKILLNITPFYFVSALVLASPEIRFQVDSETHEPLEVENKVLRETNSMVEEFMLLANITVAEHLADQFPECAMLRRHPQPNPSNFEPLIKAARNQGFEIETQTGLDLARSLDKCCKSDNPYFNIMMRILATRCMMQAVYFISGTMQRHEFHHYGLAVPIYTHFTSPIRRYSDIIVHRLLAASIGADSTYSQLLDKKDNEQLCQNLNYRHKMAQYAGRASVALNTHLFFRGKTQDEEGYILFVRKNALQVLIPKFGLEGTIYLNAFNDTQSISKDMKIVFTYNEEDHTQRCGSVIFHSFDPVTVRLSLDTRNVQHEKLVFKLIKPFIRGFTDTLDNEDAELADGKDITSIPPTKKQKLKNKIKNAA